MTLQNLPRLPLDISTFKALREENYLYVDKTQHAYNLITGGRRFFLSRPRRFGKSLLISMLKEVLLGEHDLFQGLWIHQSDYNWRPHGVITLDLSSFNTLSPDSLSRSISERLSEIVDLYKLDITLDKVDAIIDLRKVVLALHERFGRVALLIDEYDSPVLRRLGDRAQAEELGDSLHSFFSAIKGLDEYINFVFIIGVSSFAKAGIFSGMNNLQVLTLREACSDMCGYTGTEIEAYFAKHIETWANKASISYAEQRKKIKEWYNGGISNHSRL